MTIKSFLLLTTGFVLGVYSITILALSFQYDVPLTLQGKLITSTADPAVTDDERPHQFPALQLSKPIAILCPPMETDCQPEMGVTLLHLVLQESEMKQFKAFKGKMAKVKGTLFHADSGHHYTSVLLEVESLTP